MVAKNPPTAPAWLGRLGAVGPPLAVAVVIAGFTRGWGDGRLTLDGPGTAMFVRIALRHLVQYHRLGYWWPELWTGTPVWALAPALPILLALPAGAVLGAGAGVRLTTVMLQVAGGVGALVLTRSIFDTHHGTWRGAAAGVVAGVVYALDPMVIGMGVISGAETSVVVIAATPWMAWALLRALRGDGRRWVVVAAALTATAVLAQAEHAFGLTLLGLALLIGQVRRPGVSPGAVVARAAVVAVCAAGLAAFWLVPFVRLHRSFVLDTPAAVTQSLVDPVAGGLAHHPDAYLSRGSAPRGVVDFAGASTTFDHVGTDNLGAFYLGWVPVALTVAAAAALAVRPSDGEEATLPGVLAASAVCLWLSTGAVPLAQSHLAARPPVVWGAIAVVAGLVAVAWVRSLRLSPRATLVVGVALAGAASAAPWVAPLLTLRRLVPLLGDIRFPRFYPVAILGVALGAAWCTATLAGAVDRGMRSVPIPVGAGAVARASVVGVIAAAAVATVVVGAVVADDHPYAGDYDLRPAAVPAATLAKIRAALPPGRRAAAGFDGPQPVSDLLAAGVPVSVGWPTPAAGRGAWRLTGEARFSPPGYAVTALELAGSAVIALSPPAGSARRFTGLTVIPLPDAEPVVADAPVAVYAGDAALAPALAVELWRRHAGVVVSDAVPAVTEGAVGPAACTDPRRAVRAGSRFPGGTAELVALVATACSLQPWVGVVADFNEIPLSRRPGAIVTPLTGGLSAVGVWMVGGPQAILTVHDGGPGGRVLAVSTADGLDADGLTRFPLAPGTLAPGRPVWVVVSCPACRGGRQAMLAQSAPRGPGDLTIGSTLDRTQEAAMVLHYAPGAPGAAAAPGSSGAAPALGATPLPRWSTSGLAGWEVHVDTAVASVVRVAAAYFPGWSATVDGHRVPVVEADGAFIAVAAPAGRHTVRLTWRPPLCVQIGRLITVVTLLGLAASTMGADRRRRDAYIGG